MLLYSCVVYRVSTVCVDIDSTFDELLSNCDYSVILMDLNSVTVWSLLGAEVRYFTEQSVTILFR